MTDRRLPLGPVGPSKEVCSHKSVYISVLAVLILVLGFGLFYTFVGVAQPFDSLVNTDDESDINEVEISEKEVEKFQFVHITDVHGWVFAHPHDERYNADFGDFASLMEHLLADTDKETLLFDSGDIIEGSGLSDVPDIHGEAIFPIFQQIPGFGALTIGNHDIGRANTVHLMKETFIPFYNDADAENGKYLTMNSLDEYGDLLGNSYRIFRSKEGTKFLFLGFLFDFESYADNTEVITIQDTMNTEWFKIAMDVEDLEMIVVTAHVDPESSMLGEIYDAIREYHADIPLIIFSGHRHVLHYEQLDEKGQAHTMESGRYFQHIGLIEFSLQNGTMHDFSQQWIETSVQNFYNLTGTDESSFLTDLGVETKEMIQSAMDEFNILEVLGCSLHSYSPYSSFFNEDSLYRLYLDEVLPTMVNNQTGRPGYYLCNPSTLRYELYEGEITVNDVYTINPFKDPFYYFTLTSAQLQNVTESLNSKRFKYSDRMPYAGATQKEIESGFSYFYSSFGIDDDAEYDLICAEYDSLKIQKIIRDLIPELDTITAELYPTPYDATSALLNYFPIAMECSAECPCPSLYGSN